MTGQLQFLSTRSTAAARSSGLACGSRSFAANRRAASRVIW